MKISAKSIISKLRKSFRLVILHEDNFEEKVQMKLNMLNGLTVLSLGALIIVTLTAVTIIYTPIRQFIPGYTDPKLRKDLQDAYLKMQTIENELKSRDEMLKGLTQREQPAIKLSNHLEDKRAFYTNTDSIEKTFPQLTQTEKSIQNYIEKEVFYDLDPNKIIGSDKNTAYYQAICFKPVQGSVTRNFDTDKGQFGVDILAKTNEPVKTIMDGTVILSTWTTEGGYIIGIQHTNNIVSFYKHNAALLHKVGDHVKAGDVIAVAGKSGSDNNNPSLYFEVWQNGKPMDPQKFVKF